MEWCGGPSSRSHFCTMPARYWRIERQRDRAKGELGQNRRHSNEAQLAPVGSSSDEPHRWLGQIKTQLGYKHSALNEGIHSVVCQSLSWNCNTEDILKNQPNKGLVAGSFLWFKPRWLVVLQWLFWFRCDVLSRSLVVLLDFSVCVNQ